jgi:hypothetical protein
MTKEELEKKADTPCTKCIFKGKCPSENKEEVYKICKEIGGRKMTKEELKQEAEKSLDKRLGTYAYISKQDCYTNYVDGYIDSAEPREKRIAELEQENAELKAFRQDCVKLTEDNVIMARQRAETSKQLAEATEIIKKLYTVFYDPCVTESDLKYRDELFAEIKQFLSEVEK